MQGPEYNKATGRNELKMQCLEKRDTLSKALYFFPGYHRQLSSTLPQCREEESHDAPADQLQVDEVVAVAKTTDTKICAIL